MPGFYVAHHRQLDPIAGPGRCFKVGRTNNLRRRLWDQAFVTCFAGPFTFVATVETPYLDCTQRLETEFLQHTKNRRFMRANGVLSELVLMTREEIIETIVLSLRHRRKEHQIRLDPVYPLFPPFEVVPNEKHLNNEDGVN